jgi:hypothetical protein
LNEAAMVQATGAQRKPQGGEFSTPDAIGCPG